MFSAWNRFFPLRWVYISSVTLFWFTAFTFLFISSRIILSSSKMPRYLYPPVPASPISSPFGSWIPSHLFLPLCSDTRCRYSAWKRLVRLMKLQCFLLFEILTYLTSHMYHYQSAGIRIRDVAPFFVATNWSVRIDRVGAQMYYVSWKLNFSGKSQIFKYWLPASYSKCIIWGHSIIMLPQNNKNLDTPSTLVCTWLILILYFDSHLF